MANVISIIPGSVSIAGGVNVEPYRSGTMQTDFRSVAAGTHNIAGGAYSIEIFNEGIIDITVNGKTVTPGEYWKLQAFNNANSQKVDFCPAVSIIIPATGAAKYQVYRPS